jgi:hypothetical protein
MKKAAPLWLVLLTGTLLGAALGLGLITSPGPLMRLALVVCAMLAPMGLRLAWLRYRSLKNRTKSNDASIHGFARRTRRLPSFWLRKKETWFWTAYAILLFPGLVLGAGLPSGLSDIMFAVGFSMVGAWLASDALSHFVVKTRHGYSASRREREMMAMAADPAVQVALSQAGSDQLQSTATNTPRRRGDNPPLGSLSIRISLAGWAVLLCASSLGSLLRQTSLKPRTDVALSFAAIFLAFAIAEAIAMTFGARAWRTTTGVIGFFVSGLALLFVSGGFCLLFGPIGFGVSAIVLLCIVCLAWLVPIADPVAASTCVDTPFYSPLAFDSHNHLSLDPSTDSRSGKETICALWLRL